MSTAPVAAAAPRLPYEPGIDGLRAVAVVAVLVFHAGAGWLGGGFLGVSVFFTISGYLITSLLVSEWAANGRISLGAFWGRRLRRLAPASIVCIIVVLLAAPLFTSGTQQSRLPGDAAAALADVANWRFVLSGQSYADLFGKPSPLLHFWSLAIEEQFYVAYPLLMAGLLAVTTVRRRVATVLGVLAAASFVAMVLTRDLDLAYYGTHTRAFELLAGAIFAILSRGRAPLAPRAAATVGVLGLGGLGALMATVAQTDRWLYRGGFAVVALLSCAALCGVMWSAPLRWAVGHRSMALVGRVSYGLYLFHWPIFLAFDEDRFGFGGPGLLTIRVLATAAATALSYRLVESPIRFRRLLPTRRLALAGMVAGLLAGGGLVAARSADAGESQLVSRPESAREFDSGGALIFTTDTLDPSPPLPAEAPVVPSIVAVDDGSPTTTATPPPLRVLVLGSDPTLVTRLQAAAAVSSAPGGRAIEIVGSVTAECPLAPGVAVARPDGTIADISRCPSAAANFPAAVALASADIVAVGISEIDRLPIQRVGDAGMPANGDEGITRLRWSADRIADAVASLRSTGRPVLLADAGPADDFIAGRLEAIDLRESAATLLDPATLEDPESARRAIETAAAPPPATSRLRVLVAGDSTSIGTAEALFKAGGGDVDVLSIGRDACPLVSTAGVRWGSSELDVSTCPRIESDWASYLTKFHPDVVLLVASLMEQSDQRYAGDDSWHEPGDPAYVAHHDAFVTALEGLVGTSIQIAVADAPPILGGNFGGSEMARPERIAAWNATVTGWAAAWPNIHVLPYAQAVAAVEGAEPGSRRPDGVHLSPDAAETIATDVLLPILRNLAIAPPAT